MAVARWIGPLRRNHITSISPNRYAVAAWPSHVESDRCGVITWFQSVRVGMQWPHGHRTLNRTVARNHMASIGPSRYAVAAWPSHAESDRCGVITCLDINHRRNRHQHHHTFNMIVFVYASLQLAYKLVTSAVVWSSPKPPQADTQLRVLWRFQNLHL